MRVAILTSSPTGASGQCLPALHALADVVVVGVVLSVESAASHRSMWWRKLRKTIRIGPLGALNGLRIRKWWRHSVVNDVRAVAKQLGVPLVEVPSVNSIEAEAALRSWNLDVGISLGNGYIKSRIFEIPRHGMINYHGELLPEYPGALSIIWPIYDNRSKTGFTIHRINNKIDGGDILLRREFDIDFHSTLRDTVIFTGKRIHPHVSKAIADVIANWDECLAQAKTNTAGRPFTTPTIWEFIRMCLNNRTRYNLGRSVT